MYKLYREAILSNDPYSDISIDSFKKLRDEYVYTFSSDDINRKIYGEVVETKREYFKNIFNGNITLDVPLTVSKSKYMAHTFEWALSNAATRSYKNFETQLSRTSPKDGLINSSVELFKTLKTILTKEEKEKNSILSDLFLDGRRYNSGTKITKIISTIEKKFIKDSYLKEYVFNKIVPSEITSGFILSIHPTAYLFAGEISQSCYSPGHDNQHAPWFMLGDKRVLTAFNQEMNVRCFVLLDEKRKNVVIADTYPKSNDKNLSIQLFEFFSERGYSLVHSSLYQNSDDCAYYSDMSENDLLYYKEHRDVLNQICNGLEKDIETWEQKKTILKREGMTVEQNLASTTPGNIMSEYDVEYNEGFLFYFSQGDSRACLSKQQEDDYYEDDSSAECFFTQTDYYCEDLDYNIKIGDYLSSFGEISQKSDNTLRDLFALRDDEQIFHDNGEFECLFKEKESIAFNVFVKVHGFRDTFFRDKDKIEEVESLSVYKILLDLAYDDFRSASELTALDIFSKGNIIAALAEKKCESSFGSLYDNISETFTNRYLLSNLDFWVELKK